MSFPPEETKNERELLKLTYRLLGSRVSYKTVTVKSLVDRYNLPRDKSLSWVIRKLICGGVQELGERNAKMADVLDRVCFILAGKLLEITRLVIWVELQYLTHPEHKEIRLSGLPHVPYQELRELRWHQWPEFAHHLSRMYMKLQGSRALRDAQWEETSTALVNSFWRCKVEFREDRDARQLRDVILQMGSGELRGRAWDDELPLEPRHLDEFKRLKREEDARRVGATPEMVSIRCREFDLLHKLPKAQWGERMILLRKELDQVMGDTLDCQTGELLRNTLAEARVGLNTGNEAARSFLEGHLKPKSSLPNKPKPPSSSTIEEVVEKLEEDLQEEKKELRDEKVAIREAVTDRNRAEDRDNRVKMKEAQKVIEEKREEVEKKKKIISWREEQLKEIKRTGVIPQPPPLPPGEVKKFIPKKKEQQQQPTTTTTTTTSTPTGSNRIGGKFHQELERDHPPATYSDNSQQQTDNTRLSNRQKFKEDNRKWFSNHQEDHSVKNWDGSTRNYRDNSTQDSSTKNYTDNSNSSRNFQNNSNNNSYNITYPTQVVTQPLALPPQTAVADQETQRLLANTLKKLDSTLGGMAAVKGGGEQQQQQQQPPTNTSSSSSSSSSSQYTTTTTQATQGRRGRKSTKKQGEEDDDECPSDSSFSPKKTKRSRSFSPPCPPKKSEYVDYSQEVKRVDYSRPLEEEEPEEKPKDKSPRYKGGGVVQPYKEPDIEFPLEEAETSLEGTSLPYAAQGKPLALEGIARGGGGGGIPPKGTSLPYAAQGKPRALEGIARGGGGGGIPPYKEPDIEFPLEEEEKEEEEEEKKEEEEEVTPEILGKTPEATPKEKQERERALSTNFHIIYYDTKDGIIHNTGYKQDKLGLGAWKDIEMNEDNSKSGRSYVDEFNKTFYQIPILWPEKTRTNWKSKYTNEEYATLQQNSGDVVKYLNGKKGILEAYLRGQPGMANYGKAHDVFHDVAEKHTQGEPLGSIDIFHCDNQEEEQCSSFRKFLLDDDIKNQANSLKAI